MKKMKIKINNINDIKTFVNKVNSVDGDVILFRGRSFVDAKSILGIFDFDLSLPVEITYPEEAEEFEKFLKNFEC